MSKKYAESLESTQFIWKHSIPRSGWTYDGDYHDLGSMIGNCEMCDRPIRYQHLINHPEFGELNVGCICAEKMSDEGALNNRTGWKITDGADPYLIVTEKRFTLSMKNFLQLKLPKSCRLYKMISALLNCDRGENIFVYPEGGIYVPKQKPRMALLVEEKNPVLFLMKKKIKEAYEKKKY